MSRGLSTIEVDIHHATMNDAIAGRRRA